MIEYDILVNLQADITTKSVAENPNLCSVDCRKNKIVRTTPSLWKNTFFAVL